LSTTSKRPTTPPRARGSRAGKGARAPRPRRDAAGDVAWYKDAIVYQLHVRAFHDGDGDGIGDFRGLTQKLDYLQDLGVTALWLLPFYPSPLRDDGYDIADYRRVHESYGTLRQFQEFLDQAHRRGMRVITELVLNHTSDQHPWFKRARSAPAGSAARAYYVWNDAPTRYPEARIIFQDFETSNWAWDPVAGAYYWHRFYSHQPDLNFDSPAVRAEALSLVDFWLERGVDGLRLDAVPYLFERDGTNCENLPETHAFLKHLRRHIDRRFKGRMLLAEANQWPEHAAEYFGDGDECHTAFHFPLMPRLFMAVRMEDRYPILDILQQTPEIPEQAQWMVFLRNHDELTLEMVTDEERDYMYRVYASDPQARINLGIRRRLAPLLGNNRRRIELLNGLLFSMPGTPVLYYGDELGMGDNIFLGDRNGVRTPMQWSADRNAGFSRANPQRLYQPVIIDPEYGYETVNVEAQHANPSSLLWWMKRLIALRKRYRAFGRGRIEFLYPENSRVLAFVREWEDERILVVANLSRFTQPVELDLSAYRGAVPVELFGGTPFPPVGELPYFLTLGPHSFYWFKLAAPGTEPAGVDEAGPVSTRPIITADEFWEECFAGRARPVFEAALHAYLLTRRWFVGRGRRVRTVQMADSVPLGTASGAPAHLVLAEAWYYDGEAATFALPVGFATGRRAARLAREHPEAVIAQVKGGPAGLIYECVVDDEYRASLLAAIERPRHTKGGGGDIMAERTDAFRALRGLAGATRPSSVLRAEQSNTSLVYGDRLILKLYRRPEPGQNPELELGRHLSEAPGYHGVPALAGSIEYRRGRGERMTIAVLQAYVPNQGDAWTHALGALGGYFDAVAAAPDAGAGAGAEEASVVRLVDRDVPSGVRDAIGAYAHYAELLGERTAELHNALARDTDVKTIRPEPFTRLAQRALYQSMRAQAATTLRLLAGSMRALDPHEKELAAAVLAREPEVLARLKAASLRQLSCVRTRRHGDFHLGQVLFTGKDFVIIDFEGEPARPLTERRIKRSPLTDVAGMLRSFDYAARIAARSAAERSGLADAPDALASQAHTWSAWCGAAFVRGYLAVAHPSLVPAARDDLELVLRAFLLEKALYEVAFELHNRPDWVAIPLAGILRLLDETD